MNGDVPVQERRHLAIPRNNGEAPFKIPMWFIKVVVPVALSAALTWAGWVTFNSFYVKVIADDVREMKGMLHDVLKERHTGRTHDGH